MSRRAKLVRQGKRGDISRWDPIRFSAFVLTAAWFLQPASAQTPSTSSSTNAIRGVVVNSVTREPVGHALVLSADNRLATMTDDQGRFEIAPPAPVDVDNSNSPAEAKVTVSFTIAGADQLFARKPGFLGAEHRNWLRNGSPVIPGRDLTIKLVPEARIVGRVSLPNGTAFNQFPVELYRRQVFQGRAHWTLASSVSARANGEFRFADLEAGTYKLFTGEFADRDPLTAVPGGRDYGYPPVYFPNAADFQAGATIQITAGMTLQAELSPVRREYYPVRIPVGGNSPSDGVEVHVWPQGHRGPGFSLGYNPREKRIEGALPNGVYMVEATDRGPKAGTGSVSITVRDGAVESPPMTLLPHGRVRVNARLEWKSGEDTEADGEVEGVKFRIAGKGGDPNVWLESTDEFDQNSGRIVPTEQPPGQPTVFEDVPPGHYRVHVESGRGYASAIASGEVDLLRKPLNVGPGANLAIDLTMRDDGAQISGTLEDPDGHALASNLSQASGAGYTTIVSSPAISAYIYCVPLPDSSGQFREGMVTSNGALQLSQVPPGGYLLLAFDHPVGDLEYANSEAMSAYEGKGKIVRLAPGQKENVTLQVISDK